MVGHGSMVNIYHRLLPFSVEHSNSISTSFLTVVKPLVQMKRSTSILNQLSGNQCNVLSAKVSTFISPVAAQSVLTVATPNVDRHKAAPAWLKPKLK